MFFTRWHGNDKQFCLPRHNLLNFVGQIWSRKLGIYVQGFDIKGECKKENFLYWSMRVYKALRQFISFVEPTLIRLGSFGQFLKKSKLGGGNPAYGRPINHLKVCRYCHQFKFNLLSCCCEPYITAYVCINYCIRSTTILHLQ